MSLAGLVASSLFLTSSTISALTTCPGFPGYCSEAFPGSVRMPVATYINNHDIIANMINEIIKFPPLSFAMWCAAEEGTMSPSARWELEVSWLLLCWIFSLVTCKKSWECIWCDKNIWWSDRIQVPGLTLESQESMFCCWLLVESRPAS